MKQAHKITFEDTSIAFEYKSDKALRKANFIFSLVNHPWISAFATGSVKLALKLGLPVDGIVKSTVFDHFCGGESIQESERAVQLLARYGVGTILDYSVEGEKSEEGFDRTTDEIIRTIEKGRESKHVPFSVFKVTGICSTELLEKLHSKQQLSVDEVAAYERARRRVNAICESSSVHQVPVLIDAEETWIQDPIDALAYEMMGKYNKQKALIFNTFQLYRKASLQNLKNALAVATQKNYFIGAKLVRGAYMEKERARAEEKGYPSPIHDDKDGSDKDFNASLEFSIEHLDRISVMCGSHNEYSNQYLTELMSKNNITPSDKRVWFAQLFGMSDNISFNLAKEGYNVAKYVPYGPVRAVMPYLFRRAAENTSVAGQSSRELILLRRELQRRRSKK
jgi:proline dehydrogenase